MEFKETQKINLWWLYILLGIETIIVVSVMLFDKGGNGFSDLKKSYYLPVIAILLPYIIVYVVTQNKLTVTIDQFGISYSYWPFVRKKAVSWGNISALHLRKYDALGQYGGWGLRYRLWFKFNDKAFIFNDNNLGYQITLTNHKKILFSTNRLEELTLFLINIKRQYNITAIDTDVREG